MAVLASTATPVNSFSTSRWISWGMILSLAISAATPSNSCSSRCFMTWAAGSEPTITRSVASFCTFVILAKSRGAVAFSVGAAMENRKSVAHVVSAQPGADRLGHVGGILFDERVQDLHRHDPWLGLLAPAAAFPALAALPPAFPGAIGRLAQRHADGNVGRGRFLEELEEHDQHPQRNQGEERI